MKFAYHNTGTGLSWKNGPPTQTGGGDKRALGAIAVPSSRRGVQQDLGSLGGGSITGTVFDGHALEGTSLGMPLPKPGAPEPLSGCGCRAKATCGCHGSLGDTGLIAGLPTPVKVVGIAALGYLAYKHLKKRRR